MIARYASMAVFLVVVVIAAALAGSFEAGEYYSLVQKPSWAPPAWVFGPVWSVLYILMALAMWKVWISEHRSRMGSLIWWLIQLSLNVLWTWLFFGLTRTGWAMLEMLLLIGIVVLCMKAFASSSRSASWMLLPYLLWLMFAWLLNISIWLLNGGNFGFSF
jgi:benzodiazapine receptor